MKSLTEHEKKVLKIVKQYPEIVQDKAKREKIAKKYGMTEKTLRNRIADLKRYGLLIKSIQERHIISEYPPLIDYLGTILRYKSLIIILVLFCSTLVALYSLIMPKTYKSSAEIIPSEYNTRGDLFSALPTSIIGIQLGRGSSEIFRLKAILESRTLRTHVINKFGLIKIYNVDNIDKALIKLAENTSITISNENTLEVSYSRKTGWFSYSGEKEDSLKLFVKKVTSEIISRLDYLNREYQTQEAKEYREFIQERYAQVENKLHMLEDSTKKFQNKYDVIMLDEQLKANLQTAALLEAEIIKKSMEVSIAEVKYDSNSPIIKNLQAELKAAKSSLESSFGGGENETRYLLGYDRNLPKLLQEYIRLQRDLLIQTEIFKFITTKYEESKLREAENVPTIQVLDYPTVPIIRSYPRRSFMVITTAILTTIFSIILVFIIDFFHRMKTWYPEQYAELKRLRNFSIRPK